MKKLILVRYGQYENGHLTQEGIRVMTLSGERLKQFVEENKVVVVASSTPRAFESGKIVADILGTELLVNDSLYAAEEDGKFPDTVQAKEFVESFEDTVEVLIAIASREYIETLPAYILDQSIETHLERGECLVIDYENKNISYLKDN
jgi:phosphohistidine phosphatase SixA